MLIIKNILKKYCYVIIVVVLFLLILNIIINIKSLMVNNNDNRSLDKGQIAFGVYDNNKNIINTGSVITTKYNKVDYSIEVEQSLPDEREYLLLVLIDFKQVSFCVDNNIYDKYVF